VIFISYSRQDEDKVRNIVEAIRFRTEYDLWRDNQIRAGEVFNLEIGRVLGKSKAAIVFWSKHSVESEFVIDEATRAKAARKIIPVRIGACEVPTGFGKSADYQPLKS
jgi:TIR domain